MSSDLAIFTQEPKSDFELRIKAIEERLGYRICGARNREFNPCENKAGKGTDHLGEGRCKYHGGKNQSPLSKNFKHGMSRRKSTNPVTTAHPALAQKMAEVAVDHDVFDLRKEILAIRAIMQVMMDQGELGAAQKAGVDLSKVIERLHNIEVGRRYVISIENVGNIIQAVQEVIFRHVPDEFTRHLIASELGAVRLSTHLPPAPVIEAEYKVIEDDKNA